MYPSDYGYATSGGSTYDRAACMSKEMISWNEELYQGDCAFNSYLFGDRWVLTHCAVLNDATVVYSDGYVATDYGHIHYPLDVYPVVYLTTDIAIKSGDGSESNPYNLE